ncbi:ankyrin repeat-containing protein NPR4-like [Telopea speciosissima]|uniref:ankyrin repeat-containing protein NPR4-like n=1 Tax=Telopea speciosissima TaxID=54955 RepID=UPI001CC55C65|nr:ankyrin repeat-containing protein NPR4-like [Telopea speciosissima]
MCFPTWDPNSIGTSAEDKEMIQVANTGSVVAAILVTVTFAAALTIPGGCKADGPNAGSPSLIHKPALVVFFISDAIALCLSRVALVLLLTSTIVEKVCTRKTIAYSLTFVFSAICIALIAFISGFYAVISVESTWVAILVCIIGSSFPFLLAFLQCSVYAVTPSAVPVAKEANNKTPIIGEQMA